MLDEVLTDDHARIDLYLKQFLDSLKNGSRIDEDSFHVAKVSLRNHIFWEEEYLFKAVYSGNEVLIKGLEAEHGSVWKMLDLIESLLRSESGKATVIKNTEALLRVLKGHNGTEEGGIYILLDKLSNEEQAALLAKEVALASAPAGWVCTVLKGPVK